MAEDTALTPRRGCPGAWVLAVLLLFTGHACALAAESGAAVPTRRLPDLAAGEKVGPRLAELLDASAGDRVITVLADLPVQVDLAALGARMSDAGLSRGQRAETVREALRTVAERQQAAVAGVLEGWRSRGWVRSWRGVRIVNRLILETRVDAVRELAASPELARLWDGERIRPLRSRPRPVSLDAGRWPRELRRDNWALDAMGLPALWKRRHDGRGTVVGILDSGVDGAHPQLARNHRRKDGWFDPVEGRPEPWDSAGHGTAVLSCAVARNVGGHRIGVAPRATWVAALANPGGVFHPARFTEAADWMLYTGRPDVLLMAFGFEPGTCDDSLRPFIDAFRAAEIFCVLAAGNDGPGPGTDIPPANLTGLYPGGAAAFAVGGQERDLGHYPKSGSGPNSCGGEVYPTVVAPAAGLQVAQASDDEPYGWMEGTSFAAAYAAGAVALAYQQQPDALLRDLEEALAHTARDLGLPGPDDRHGHGALEPAAALRWLEGRRPE